MRFSDVMHYRFKVKLCDIEFLKRILNKFSWCLNDRLEMERLFLIHYVC
jgi:hypothetical protein